MGLHCAHYFAVSCTVSYFVNAVKPINVRRNDVVVLQRVAFTYAILSDQMSNQEKMISYCPICGKGPFPEPVPEDELRASFWICECCGCEYGYTDHPPYREWWLKKMRKMGTKARWAEEEYRPADWNLGEQLSHIDPTWNV